MSSASLRSSKARIDLTLNRSARPRQRCGLALSDHSNLAREMDAGAQAAMRRGLESDLATVTARHITGNRQAEADSSCRWVA